MERESDEIRVVEDEYFEKPRRPPAPSPRTPTELSEIDRGGRRAAGLQAGRSRVSLAGMLEGDVVIVTGCHVQMGIVGDIGQRQCHCLVVSFSAL